MSRVAWSRARASRSEHSGGVAIEPPEGRFAQPLRCAADDIREGGCWPLLPFARAGGGVLLSDDKGRAHKTVSRSTVTLAEPDVEAELPAAPEPVDAPPPPPPVELAPPALPALFVAPGPAPAAAAPPPPSWPSSRSDSRTYSAYSRTMRTEAANLTNSIGSPCQCGSKIQQSWFPSRGVGGGDGQGRAGESHLWALFLDRCEHALAEFSRKLYAERLQQKQHLVCCDEALPLAVR